jgi:hypothetical protein
MDLKRIRHPEESRATSVQDRQTGPASSDVRASIPSSREDQDEHRSEAADGPCLTDWHCG